MSLVNQMLRDLQQRQKGQSAAPPPAPARRPRRPRRRMTIVNLVGTVPPILWVGTVGLAGIILLWGLSGWLSGLLGLGSTGPVTKPPADMVAIANAPPAATSGTPPATRRQAPPSPVNVPPPAPPLAYGSAEPAVNLPVPTASSATPPAPATALPQTPTTVFSDRPVHWSPPVATAVSRKDAVDPAPVPPTAARIPGVAVNPPGRLHPDLLPGAVNATNLALQKAAREAAAVPPVVTPYGQAEAAYREGRAAYEANRIETTVAKLRLALGFYPGHLPARELLADQLELVGQGDEAFNLLQQGLAIAPDYAPFRKRAARLLLDRGDAAGATRVLTGSGLPRIEDDPELHRLLAGSYQRLGENFLAAQTFRNLLVDDPRNGRLWVGLGDALAADGQTAEARKAYRRALVMGGLSREDAVRARAGSGQR